MRITYLFDPLCGWCYGAGPALERLALWDGLVVDLAPTGLFAGEGARPMDASFASYAWQNDQRIARLTGQPFSEAYRSRILGDANRMFDSAPGTLGVIAAGLNDPALELPALKALQYGRYVEGRDNSDRSVVADILAERGWADAADRVRTPDEDLLAAYRRRIDAARSDMARFGANGVPAIVIGEGTKRRLLPGGALFGDFDTLIRELQAA